MPAMNRTMTCSAACLSAHHVAKRPPMPGCKICGAACPWDQGHWKATCSETCENIGHSRTMSSTNRVHASGRMRARNPMRHESVRAKVSSTLREMGHAPRVRGGNGRGPTISEASAASRCGLDTNLIVRTMMPRGSGYPQHYKVDVGDASILLAIEIDGPSHCALARREQDRRKENLLRLLGWTVLRFTNREVTERLEDVAREVSSTISRLRGSTTSSRTGS